MSKWICELELDASRRVTRGGFDKLVAAAERGADLRIYTEWRFDEHMAPYLPELDTDDRKGLVREVMDFRQTVLVGAHLAGVTTLRQPLCPTVGFNGTAPKLAFFLYNMSGEQASANLSLNISASFGGTFGARTLVSPPRGAEKMSVEETFDVDTASPCRNFFYAMEVFRFFIRDDWEEVYAHDGEGNPVAGSFDRLLEAHQAGRDLKVAIQNPYSDVRQDNSPPHQIFTMVGSSFYHEGRRTFECGTHPFVRIRPTVPLRYASGEWDLCWLALCTDGRATIRQLDPQTRLFSDKHTRLGVRWFAQ